MKIYTIGVYDFEEEQFFQALRDAGVELFCDLRWRRGLRGAKYAFANYKRLLARLESMEIAYLHRRDLAPTPEIRARQKEADTERGVAKRKRRDLSPEFIQAYRQAILSDFDPRAFLDALPAGTNKVVLFCVEREPEACHRSLVAQKLAEQPGVELEHLFPDSLIS